MTQQPEQKTERIEAVGEVTTPTVDITIHIDTYPGIADDEIQLAMQLAMLTACGDLDRKRNALPKIVRFGQL